MRPRLGIVIGEHAWCLDAENDYAVVDRTWDNTAGGVYLGIPFRLGWLTEAVLKAGYYGVLDSPAGGCLPLDADPARYLAPIPAPPDFAYVPAPRVDTTGAFFASELENG